MTWSTKVLAPAVGLLLAMFSGCATYSGPQLTTVMATACAGQSSFSTFRSCINTHWYSRVTAQGYGGDPRAQQFMNRMHLLGQAVSQGQISDLDAIANATNLAYQLRSIEQAEIARQNDALLQALSRSLATPPASTSSRSTVAPRQTTVSCTRIGDLSRQIYTFNGIACPAGYAPTL